MSVRVTPLVRAAALATLTVQNAAQALIVKYSRSARPAGVPPYVGSSVVLVCEIFKLFASAALLQAERGRALAELRAAPWRRSWLFAVPAAVYALQNNMLLVAVRRLDPPTFLVLSQAKIMTTAGFSVALLGRRLHRVRWTSLALLMIGVALVQNAPAAEHAHGNAAVMHHDVATPALPRGTDTDALRSDDAPPSAVEYSGGVVAVLLMCACSGFAAVYTECVLKRLRLHTQVCNAFMAAYGIVFAALGALLADGPLLAHGGLLQGWTPCVYGVVVISAAGGLLVAFFLRYLDSILKNFASTCAIVLSTAASVPLFGFALTSQWLLGAAIVLAAIALYNEPDVADPPPLAHPPLGLLALFMDAAGGGPSLDGKAAGGTTHGAVLPTLHAPSPARVSAVGLLTPRDERP